jgi:hypothetical protein
MIRLRADITTYCGSIGSTVRSFLFSNSLLLAIQPTQTSSQGIQANFSDNITFCAESDRYCSLVFRLGRIVLVPLLPQIPSGCRRDFTVTSLTPEVELTFNEDEVDRIASFYCPSNSNHEIPQSV